MLFLSDGLIFFFCIKINGVGSVYLFKVLESFLVDFIVNELLIWVVFL